ncbi:MULTISPECIES: nuclear transport factor 2 family protein [unclassified Afipia]|uniref:YybH family protein n=1 Tax=unclassified Afipia TaxID=2642050 RepID=UPI000421DAE4|nr:MULTISPECIES: nuclear transport factor 2 family protein [unclassified Afipia]
MSRAQLAEKSLDTEALFERYHVGWKTRNPDLIASLHSEDTIFWVHDGAGPIRGREALRQHCVELFDRLEFRFEEGRLLYGSDFWVFEWLMVVDLTDTGGKPFTAKIEMLDVFTVNPAGEVTRKDVYVNGTQRVDAFTRAGLSASRN